MKQTTQDPKTLAGAITLLDCATLFADAILIDGEPSTYHSFLQVLKAPKKTIEYQYTTYQATCVLINFAQHSIESHLPNINILTCQILFQSYSYLYFCRQEKQEPGPDSYADYGGSVGNSLHEKIGSVINLALDLAQNFLSIPVPQANPQEEHYIHGDIKPRRPQVSPRMDRAQKYIQSDIRIRQGIYADTRQRLITQLSQGGSIVQSGDDFMAALAGEVFVEFLDRFIGKHVTLDMLNEEIARANGWLRKAVKEYSVTPNNSKGEAVIAYNDLISTLENWKVLLLEAN